jgi:hypothetical protein
MSCRSAVLPIVFLLIFGVSAGKAHASPLSDALAWWQPPQAFLCYGSNVDFPSKFSTSDAAHCDDGDMTLFNGVICVSGDQRGCDGVRLAQGADGRWWRSPRRIGWTYPTYDVSFSPDQALGVMLYTGVAKNVIAFDGWVQWMADNRPCLVEIGGNCVPKGWLRYCTDDIPDRRCTLRPGDCTYLKATGIYLGSSKGDLCDKVLDELPSAVAPFPKSAILSVPAQVYASASVNQVGFPLHLAAVALLLARTLEIKDSLLDSAGQTLAARQNQNPFFQYLSTGVTSGTITLLLNLCPNSNRPSNGRNQWSWERDQNDKAWLDSMYWDCIFLGNALQR